MRALCSDWTLGEYFSGIRLAVSPAYTAEDVYLGNRLGALEALNAGVTTILDFSHCNNSPDHSDAAVAGLQDAGIRGIFAYAFSTPAPKRRSSSQTTASASRILSGSQRVIFTAATVC